MHGDIFYMYQTTLVSVTVDSGLIRSHGRESDENPGQEEQAPTSDADKTRIGACRRVLPLVGFLICSIVREGIYFNSRAVYVSCSFQ